MSITEYISSAPAEWQATLTTIHETILANDSTVVPVMKPMRGKEMILYEERCYMKYGLAITSKYMSLHCLPMYNITPIAAYTGTISCEIAAPGFAWCSRVLRK